MLFAAATVAAGLLASGGWRDAFPFERQYIGFGLVAALHFLLFVTSLSFTTIAHALSITYLAPVLTAIAAWRFLGEKLIARQLAGIGLAIIGIAVLVGFEPRLSGSMLLGDGLALLSAACYAIYSIVGRSQRTRFHLLAYTTAVYGLAAAWLIPAFVAGFLGAGRPDGAGTGVAMYSWQRVLALVGSGVLPLGVGHTLYNASLRRMPATYANLIASQEVTGGVALGVLILGEIPSANSIAGAVLAIAGIVLVLL
jgi:drug/metabolite transporter (DMT)-like permease